MQRRFAAFTLGLFIALLAPVLAQPAAAQARKKGPTAVVRVRNVTPKTLGANGSNVTLRVQVTVRNGRANAVHALGKVAGGATGQWIRLTQRKNGIYAGTIRVPGNPTTRRTTAEIYLNIDARGAGGRKNIRRVVARLPVQKGDDSLPPPPPLR
jgi:hypothetical protein